MRYVHTRPTRRAGFTLVELLVVIAIIATLVSLTSAAVMRYLIVGPRMNNKNDIDQMATALESARQQFGVDYFPSLLVLCENVNSYDPMIKLDVDSLQFLNRMFGRINWAGGIDWNGNGKIDSVKVTLTGDQCLVFFLGGIPTPPTDPVNGCLGFSSNLRKPANVPFQGESRRGPYFPFRHDRLVRGSNGFFSYLDEYRKKPYAYFSSYKSENGYNRYFALTAKSDCPGLCWPYAEASGSTIRYHRPRDFQIISAGADLNFGPGTDLTVPGPPKGPGPFVLNINTAAGMPTGGLDDQANFSASLLGSPK